MVIQMRRTLDILAIIFLMTFFLLGLVGNDQEEGQLYLLIVLVATAILFLRWGYGKLSDEFKAMFRDWRAVTVAQFRKNIKIPADIDLALALKALQNKEYDQAATILWVAAEQGNSTAQYLVSGLFDRGRGVPRSREEALKWLSAAAHQGVPEAEGDLGYYYLKDSPGEAVIWLQRASEKGIAGAQTQLGKLFEEGRGVKKDIEAAAQWYREAAEQDHIKAQAYLGRLYLQGKGIPKDLVQAYMWLSLAAEKGDLLAARALHKSKHTIRPEQKKEAAWLSDAWRQKIEENTSSVKQAARRQLRAKRHGQSMFALDHMRDLLIADQKKQESAAQANNGEIAGQNAAPGTADAPKASDVDVPISKRLRQKAETERQVAQKAKPETGGSLLGWVQGLFSKPAMISEQGQSAVRQQAERSMASAGGEAGGVDRHPLRRSTENLTESLARRRGGEGRRSARSARSEAQQSEGEEASGGRRRSSRLDDRLKNLPPSPTDRQV